MMHDLDTLEQFIKQSFPNDAHMPGMTVSAAASSAACPVGKVVIVVPGNKSELERTVCGKQLRDATFPTETYCALAGRGDLLTFFKRATKRFAHL